MTYVEWIEPFDCKCRFTVVMRMKLEDVVAWQKESVKDRLHAHFKGYSNDKEALQAFMVVQWAKIVEVNE